MEHVLSKICKKCGIDKPLNCFHNQKGQKDGKRPKCKDCRKAETQEYYAQNKDIMLQKSQARYEKNKEELNRNSRERWAENTEKNNAYREKHAEKRRAYTRKWLADNKERRAQFLIENKDRMNADARTAYHANPERQYEASRRYIESNRDKVRATHRRWVKNNPAKAKIKYNRRRSAKKLLPTTLTAQQWMDCLATFKNKCAYCGGSPEVLHQEHVIAQKHGGGYVKENIVPACLCCNSSKGAKPMISWYVRRKYFDYQRLEKILTYLYGDFNATNRTVETPPFPAN